MTRSVKGSRLGARWWLARLMIVGFFLSSCSTPALPPDNTVPATPPRETTETTKTIQTDDLPAAPQPVGPALPLEQPAPQPAPPIRPPEPPPREQLERRMKEVMACLEKARQAVVTAEIGGASFETVRPAIDALSRAEAALREAQSQLLSGDAAQAVSPLERAEAECRTVLARSH